MTERDHGVVSLGFAPLEEEEDEAWTPIFVWVSQHEWGRDLEMILVGLLGN